MRRWAIAIPLLLVAGVATTIGVVLAAGDDQDDLRLGDAAATLPREVVRSSGDIRASTSWP